MELSDVSHVLFDLDGTLTDPAEGIIGCFYYAFERMGLPAPDSADLDGCIGPPIRVTFARLLDAPDAAQVERAVACYRERYGTVGLFEARVYAGVPEMLSALRAASLRLVLVTAKAWVYATRVMDRFGLSGYFDAIYGPELNGRFDDKRELMAHAIETSALDPAKAVMVGDRATDMIAARVCGVRGLGVSYGYGSTEELTEAGAAGVVHSPAEVVRCLAGRSGAGA